MPDFCDFYGFKKKIYFSENLSENDIKNRVIDLHKTFRKMSSLIIATVCCKFSIFEEIFNSNPDMINDVEDCNRTPIIYSIIYGFRDKFDFLLKKNANLILPNLYNDQNLLMISVEQKDPYFLKRILDLKIFNIDQEDRIGNTALMIAIKCSNIMAIKLILAYGANISHVSKKPELRDVIKTFFLFRNKNLNLLKYLVAKSKNTYNSLSYFSGNKRDGIRSIDVLLEAGASPNQSNSYGTTPLMIAVKNQIFPIVKSLVKHKADISAKTRTGEDAIDIAIKINSSDIFSSRRDIRELLTKLYLSRESITELYSGRKLDKIIKNISKLMNINENFIETFKKLELSEIFERVESSKIFEKLTSSEILKYLIIEYKWQRRINFILVLSESFRTETMHSMTVSKILNMNTIFGFNRLNPFIRTIMSYL